MESTFFCFFCGSLLFWDNLDPERMKMDDFEPPKKDRVILGGGREDEPTFRNMF